MREVFTVAVKRTLSVSEFFDIVNLPAFEYCGRSPNLNTALTGKNHFYRNQISCRGVEIEFTQFNTSYLVKANHPSSSDDLMLAVHIAQALAHSFAAEIVVNENVFDSRSFSERYNMQWSIDSARLGVVPLLTCSFDNGDCASLDCAVRPFYIGERVHRDITSESSDDIEAHEKLFTRIYATQYVGPDFFVPKQYEIFATKQKFVFIGPTVKMVTPYVDYLSLADNDDRILFVPYSILSTLMGEHLTWLDEKQALIGPLSGNNWADFLKVARHSAVDLQYEIESGVGVIVSTAKSRYDRLVESAKCIR